MQGDAKFGKANFDRSRKVKTEASQLKYTNLALYFDQSLFEAPPIIKKLEDELAQQEKETAFKK